MKLFVRWLVTVVAVAAAVWLVPGINVVGADSWLAVFVVAAVLALLNIFIKPIIGTLSGCLLFITFGLFALIINAGLLYFSAWLCTTVFGIGFTIDGFWPAFWGGLIISVVTVILNAITGTSDNDLR